MVKGLFPQSRIIILFAVFSFCHGQLLVAAPSLFLIGLQISEPRGKGPTVFHLGMSSTGYQLIHVPLTLNPVVALGTARDLKWCNLSDSWEFAGNVGTWTLFSLVNSTSYFR